MLLYHAFMMSASHPDVVLAADIGATNARFALVEQPQNEARIVFQRIYPTASFPDFEPALQTFLHEASYKPTRAAIAIAGPVDAHSGRLTNRPSWTVNRQWLASLGIDAKILNDFQALAYGVSRAQPDDYVVLQEGQAKPATVIAAVGAGTGLGVSTLFWNGQRYQTSASEGGHVGFAPRNETEVALLQHLQTQHGRVSAERIISGAGLVAIYDFMRLQWPQADPLGKPADVSGQALADPSGVAAKALDLFIACYGAFAGDMALAFLARDGLFVSGGIAAKLAHRFAAGDFMDAFNDKGRLTHVTRSVPVRIVTNELLGMIGAAYAAAE